MNKNLVRFSILFIFFSIINYFLYTFIQSNYIDTILVNKFSLFLIILFIIVLLLFMTIFIRSLLYKNRLLLKKLERKDKKLKNKIKDVEELSNQIVINRQKDKIFYEKSKILSMNELILNITHFWRQPLSAISTLSTSMQIHNDIGILDSSDINKNCKLINKNTQYLSSVIEKFINPSKKRKKELFNIEQLSNDILKHTKCEQIIFENYLKEESTIFNHKNELIQVLVSMIKNSNEIFNKRLIENRYVFLTFNMNEENLIITLKDTAGGIEENNLTKIFEPYFTTKEKALGVGLGLYLAYIIVSDIIIGKIGVKNEKFKYKNRDYNGASFTIEIPF